MPGGINFEMPPCDEMCKETNHKKILSGKLKNTAYKKLKNKLETTKVMFFNKAPTLKPSSIVLELNGFDLSHMDIYEQINKFLKDAGGWKVVELEFIPRSVHFGSVFADNLWIVTLNEKDAQHYLISNGIVIDGHKALPKSHDEFMNTEYERFIRAEKYRELIKNHEKAISNQSKHRK